MHSTRYQHQQEQLFMLKKSKKFPPLSDSSHHGHNIRVWISTKDETPDCSPIVTWGDNRVGCPFGSTWRNQQVCRCPGREQPGANYAGAVYDQLKAFSSKFATSCLVYFDGLDIATEYKGFSTCNRRVTCAKPYGRYMYQRYTEQHVRYLCLI